MQKKCCKCKQTKKIEEFNKCKSGKFGLHNHCRDCQKITRRAWYLKNIDAQRSASSEYSKTDKAKQQRKRRYDKHKDRILEENRIRRRTPHARKLANAARQRKLENDHSFRMAQNLRCRIRIALKRRGLLGIKREHLKEVLGCTLDELKVHIEKQFKDGMTWDNYGVKGWHIDHIIPCKHFDLTKEEERRKCFHYTNLQPLWWIDNISKHCRIPDEQSN